MSEHRPLDPIEQQGVLEDITGLLVHVLPAGWHTCHVEYRALGEYHETAVLVRHLSGAQTMLPAPAGLAELFDALRTGMYRPGIGTWFTARFQLDFPFSYQVQYVNDAEPDWQQEPPAEAVRRELELFAREDRYRPEWLRQRARGASASAGGELRRAKLFDSLGSDGRSPSVSRPAVPAEELDRLLEYLQRAPVVLAARGFDRDALDPEGRSRVPLTFHTDGTWIWAGAVGYYLREHSIPPEPDLLAHIRALGFRLPDVDDRVRSAAVSMITGAPVPNTPEPAAPPVAEEPTLPPAAQQPGPTAEEQQQVLARQAREARERSALRRLRRRLEELGVDPAVYRLDEVADDAWCMVGEGEDGWAVFWSERGGRHDPIVFHNVNQAAGYLLGTLLLVPARMRPAGAAQTSVPIPADATASRTEAAADGGAAPKPSADPGGPITPLPGEPPLSLFRDLHEVELPVGTELDRFGYESGNLTYEAGTDYSRRSLPPEWLTRGYHVYRVQRPLRALTGTAISWFEQPGGGIAYLLAASIEEFLTDGALIEVPAPGRR